MIAANHDAELGRFRTTIARRLGLSFDESRLAFLAAVLDRRTNASGGGAAHYLDRIDGPVPILDELRELARELTVGETYFFRHLDQFRAFAEVALPHRIVARSSVRQLRLLSAGCASGDEAYSLAILVRERGLAPSWDVSVHGVDLNPAMLEKAARARYSSWSLRETPAAIQRRWFVPDGREFSLDPAIRAAVAMEERNLTLDDPVFWREGRFDVVFCRNVIMYFAPETQERVVARLAKALAPGGYLFLGHAETLRGLSNDFELCHTHDTFYYRRKGELGRAPNDALASTIVPRNGKPPLIDIDWTATWVETVQRASDRIKALTASPADPAITLAQTDDGVGVDLGIAVELLKKERFAEALLLLESLPPNSDVILLRAVLLTHSGELERAKTVCAELIELDGFSAGAHYLLALCAEGIGDRQKAVEHDQIAAYLDPAFAMPRLHLGLLARRAGDREGAQRDLSQAVLLIGVEDASRLLMFGGGFSRQGLIALCEAELGKLGGKV